MGEGCHASHQSSDASTPSLCHTIGMYGMVIELVVPIKKDAIHLIFSWLVQIVC